MIRTALLVVTALCCVVDSALACQCSLPTPEECSERAEEVFEATVVRTSPTLSRCLGEWRILETAVLRTTRTFKGAARPEHRLAMGFSSCALRLENGQSYLVFARSAAADVRECAANLRYAHTCSGTMKVADAASHFPHMEVAGSSAGDGSESAFEAVRRLVAVSGLETAVVLLNFEPASAIGLLVVLAAVIVAWWVWCKGKRAGARWKRLASLMLLIAFTLLAFGHVAAHYDPSAQRLAGWSLRLDGD